MNDIPADVRRKILYIIHRGLTDIRERALFKKDQQIADLADALEILLGILERWNDEQRTMVDFVLRNYQQLHPEDRYKLHDHFVNQPTPEHF